MGSSAQLQLIKSTPREHWLTWQTDLFTVIDQVADYYDTYTRASDKLRSATSLQINLFSAFEALQSAVHGWMDDKCKAVTKDNSEGANLSISRDELKGDVGAVFREDVYQRCGAASMGSMSACALSEPVKSSIDVMRFYSELMCCAQNLVGRSRIQSSKDLSHQFELYDGSISTEGPLHIKRSRSFYVLPITLYSSEGQHVQERLRRVKNHIQVMEFESGIEGFSDLLQRCIETAESAGYFNSVPSRTKVVDPKGFEAVFYNSSIKLHVSREAVHALIGFVKEYVTDTRIRKITLAE